MRMPCTTNQSSVAKAWQEFDEAGRMKPGPFRERVVDVMEEHIKFTRLMRARRADFPVDREMTARLPEIAREPTSSSIGISPWTAAGGICWWHVHDTPIPWPSCRYSERKEIADKGKLLTQAEKEGAELIESKKP
mmetsp:Transcript_18415/g.58830  ORF Transcript_18415/g.58830 Transcript_18415/m.58830 type:complete len:135 (+) Transcript_18415:71-475(+)